MSERRSVPWTRSTAASGRKCAGTLALAAMAVVGPASAARLQHPIELHPIDGGHWRAAVGLPDRIGNARQALVRRVDGSDPHPEIATVTGYEGQPTSRLGTLGFAVFDLPGGIVPCVRVAFIDRGGAFREVMLLSSDRVGWNAESVEDHPDWTRFTFTGELPAGFVVSIDLGLHVDEGDSPEPVLVLVDDVQVNDKVWTAAADNGH